MIKQEVSEDIKNSQSRMSHKRNLFSSANLSVVGPSLSGSSFKAPQSNASVHPLKNTSQNSVNQQMIEAFSQSNGENLNSLSGLNASSTTATGLKNSQYGNISMKIGTTPPETFGKKSQPTSGPRKQSAKYLNSNGGGMNLTNSAVEAVYQLQSSQIQKAHSFKSSKVNTPSQQTNQIGPTIKNSQIRQSLQYQQLLMQQQQHAAQLQAK